MPMTHRMGKWVEAASVTSTNFYACRVMLVTLGPCLSILTFMMFAGVQSLQELCMAIIRSALLEHKSLEPEQLKIPDYVPTRLKHYIVVSCSSSPPHRKLILSHRQEQDTVH